MRAVVFGDSAVVVMLAVAAGLMVRAQSAPAASPTIRASA